MQTSVPEVMDVVERAGSDVRPLRPRRPRRRAPSPPTACSPAGWPSATCASSSSTTPAGTTTAACPAASAGSARTSTAPTLRPDHRPQAARPARRHAGRLGRRVRPDQLLAGQAHRRPTTAATTTRAASPPGWPAAASSRASPTAQTDDFGYNVADDGVHVHDFQATILHLLGIDHEKLTYKFQGRRLPADRRGGEGRQRRSWRDRGSPAGWAALTGRAPPTARRGLPPLSRSPRPAGSVPIGARTRHRRPRRAARVPPPTPAPQRPAATARGIHQRRRLAGPNLDQPVRKATREEFDIPLANDPHRSVHDGRPRDAVGVEEGVFLEDDQEITVGPPPEHLIPRLAPEQSRGTSARCRPRRRLPGGIKTRCPFRGRLPFRA